jgi:Leucine-rich repeat (LRR) protein
LYSSRVVLVSWRSLASWTLNAVGGVTEFLSRCFKSLLGHLAAPATLGLGGCSGLTALPESLGQLATLTTLDLSDCGGVTWNS